MESCSTDGEDTFQLALLARGDQGYHETEVNFGSEADLHKHWIDCGKNPGHSNFIPVKEFNINNLPLEYRDEDILKYIKTQSELTVRVVSSFTSSKRPPGYAFYNCRGKNFQRLGTGFVQYVYRNDTRTGKTCPCPECVSSQTPHVEWAKVKVRTATHVVFDDAEARNTVVELFYDDDADKGAVKRLYGDNVRFGALQGDWCDMRCVTHDVELVDYLKDTWGMWRWLETKINQKYSDQDHRLAVVVSHPHGCDKQVSVGSWKERNVVDRSRDFDNCVYTYDTPTCPGSSGAPVWILGKMKWAGFFGRHPHSGRPLNGLNVSAVGWDRRITTSK
uniref:Peptidase S1 domain-containing protein n=1 Tax=Biomphalaria glabrata TaxID=6526 RepID=A0A2C9M0Z6_BIOGL